MCRTTLQQPGVQDQPRTCLHALLGILEKNISADEARPAASARVIELCYKLLHLLCSHPSICEIMLRFLRSSNFLGRQVRTSDPGLGPAADVLVVVPPRRLA